MQDCNDELGHRQKKPDRQERKRDFPFMIETWHQWTCNGCGATENTDTPNLTRAEVYSRLKDSGWQHFHGGLDYCRNCVTNGNARKRVTDMNS